MINTFRILLISILDEIQVKSCRVPLYIVKKLPLFSSEDGIDQMGDSLFSVFKVVLTLCSLSVKFDCLEIVLG